MAKKDEYQLTPQDAAEILATTIKELREAGLQVGLANKDAAGERPAGLMVFVVGVKLVDGSLVYGG